MQITQLKKNVLEELYLDLEMSYNSLQKLKLKVLKSILIIFYKKVVFLFCLKEKSFKKMKKINFSY